MIGNQQQERKQGLMLQHKGKDRLQYKDKKITGVDRLQKERQRIKDGPHSKERQRRQLIGRQQQGAPQAGPPLVKPQQEQHLKPQQEQEI